jgi:hypothetical protein
MASVGPTADQHWYAGRDQQEPSEGHARERRMRPAPFGGPVLREGVVRKRLNV